MVTVDVGEAKDQFSELLKRAEAGETVRICRNGIPVVVLVAAPKIINPLDANVPRICTHVDGEALRPPWPDDDPEMGGKAWGL